VKTIFAGQLGVAGDGNGVGTNATFRNVRGLVVYGSTLYVCDGNRVRAVNLTNATVSTYAGSPTNVAGTSDATGTNATFTSVGHIAVDSSGNLFVTETFGSGSLRRITTGSVVQTYGPSIGFPSGVAVDSSGNVYVMLSNSGAIRKYTASSAFTPLAGDGTNVGSLDGVGTNAKFTYTWGLIESGGNLYTSGAGRIRKVTLTSAVVSTVAGSTLEGNVDGVGFNASFCVNIKSLTARDGVIYVADTLNGAVRKVEIVEPFLVTAFAGGETAGNTDGTGTSAKFQALNGDMVCDSSGNLYVAERGGNRVRKVTPGGVVTLVAGSDTAATGYVDATGSNARFIATGGIALDPLELNIFVGDIGNRNIRRINLATSVVTTWAGSTVGGAGGAGSNDGVGTAATFNGCTGFAVDSVRNRMYFADYNNHTIRKIELGSIETSTIAGLAGTSGFVDGLGGNARFNFPWSCATDTSGNVFIADEGNYAIRRMTPDGVINTIVAGNINVPATWYNINTFFNSYEPNGWRPSIFKPAYLKVDVMSNVYFTEFSTSRVRKITPGGYTTIIAGGGQTTAGNFTTSNFGTNARFSRVSGIAIDPSGNLYIADTDNFAVRKITMNSLTYSASAPPIAGLLTSRPYSPYPELITIPASIPVNCNIANFTILKDSLPTVSSVDGTFSLTLDAIGNASTPTSLFFRIFDGYTLVGTGNTISLNQSTLSSYTSSIFLPERTYTSNLTLSLFTAATTSSAATLYMNGSNSSYLKTTIPNQISALTSLKDSTFVGINCNSPQTNLDVRGSAMIWCDNNISTGNRNSASNFGTFGVGVDNLILRTTESGLGARSSASLLFTSARNNYPFGRISGEDSYTGAWRGDLVFETQYTGAMTERMRIRGSGETGIGTSSPGYTLHVVGQIYATSAITSNSDVRLKNIIGPISNGLAIVDQLNPITFTMKNDITARVKHGFLAQEIREILPDMVYETPDETKMLHLSYSDLVAPLTSAVKELSARLALLESQFAASQTPQ
jgi:sugar lactone lactonase YvrE